MGKMMDDDMSIERVIQYNNFVSNRRSDMQFLTQKVTHREAHYWHVISREGTY
jgi:hypothetical protein